MTRRRSFPILTAVLPALAAEGLRLALASESGWYWRGPDCNRYWVIGARVTSGQDNATPVEYLEEEHRT